MELKLVSPDAPDPAFEGAPDRITGDPGSIHSMPAAARKTATTRQDRDSSVDEIYERIYVAILEHRLQPGTKLGEERMADIFGVSRARIREVLARLAHEQIVELFPQRGAYVAKPTIEQARDVFEARRLIEPAVLRRLIETLTPEKVARLRQHSELEADAHRRNDRRAVIRLSGEFHTLVAELAGNSALARSMRELCMLTCLTKLMLGHLDHIEGSLNLGQSANEADLEAIFKG